MKNQIKHYPLFIISALISFCFINCQKDAATVLNDKIVISNTSVSSISQIRATVSAKIVSNGGDEITERGICFDTVAHPTVSSKKMVYDSTKVDSFSVRLSGLIPTKTYYARAYATNSKGTGYGDEVTFTTHGVKIGDLFEGGTVFYVDPTGMHGLIAALQGLNYDTTWGCKGVLINGTSTAIGSGNANSLAIIKGCKSVGTAAQWAEGLQHQSFNDWYLPSKDELLEMFKHRDVVILNDAERWSSSEVDANSAWALSFDATGAPVPVIRDKGLALGVRPIRSFNY